MTPTKENKGHNLPLLIENWMTLNKTPFSDWKVCTQHKNILLICLEIFEEMEMVLRKDRKDHIPVKMAFREIKDDIEILCTYQVQPYFSIRWCVKRIRNKYFSLVKIELCSLQFFAMKKSVIWIMK